MSASHIVCLKATHMVEMIILHTTHMGDGKIEDITTTQHHLDHHIYTMISENFTTGSQPGKVIGFITPFYTSILIMSFTHVTIIKINDKHHKMPYQQLLRVIH